MREAVASQCALGRAVAAATSYTRVLVAARGQLAFSKVPVPTGLCCRRLGQCTRYYSIGLYWGGEVIVASLVCLGVRCRTKRVSLALYWLCRLRHNCRGTGYAKHFEAINSLSCWRHSVGWKIFFPLATRFRWN